MRYDGCRVVQRRRLLSTFLCKRFLLASHVTRIAAVKVSQTAKTTKFKVRCSKYLYTLSVTDKEKADKLKQSLPPGLTVTDI